MGELNPVPVRDPALVWFNAITRLDGCPGCLNSELPRTWAKLPNGWMLAYLCSDCGATWMFETKEK